MLLMTIIHFRAMVNLTFNKRCCSTIIPERTLLQKTKKRQKTDKIMFSKNAPSDSKTIMICHYKCRVQLTVVEVVGHEQFGRGNGQWLEIVTEPDGTGSVARLVRLHVERSCAADALETPRAQGRGRLVGRAIIVHGDQTARRAVQQHAHAVQPVRFEAHAELAAATGPRQAEHHPEGASRIRPAHRTRPTLVQADGPHRVFR